MKKMSFKEIGTPTIVLFVICLVVSAALAVTNMLTKDKIAQNALESEIAARQAVLAGTEYVFVSEENGVSVYAVLVSESYVTEFISESDLPYNELTNTDVSLSDHLTKSVLARVWYGVASETDVVTATDLSATDVSETDISATDMYIIGYVATASAKGYGGDVQIMIGVDLGLKVTGIEILSQSETAGLGANCQNPQWLSQFIGKSGELKVSKDGGEIDAITASTITSRAVTSAVNKALRQIEIIEGRQA